MSVYTYTDSRQNSSHVPFSRGLAMRSAEKRMSSGTHFPGLNGPSGALSFFNGPLHSESSGYTSPAKPALEPIRAFPGSAFGSLNKPAYSGSTQGSAGLGQTIYSSPLQKTPLPATSTFLFEESSLGPCATSLSTKSLAPLRALLSRVKEEEALQAENKMREDSLRAKKRMEEKMREEREREEYLRGLKEGLGRERVGRGGSVGGIGGGGAFGGSVHHTRYF